MDCERIVKLAEDNKGDMIDVVLKSITNDQLKDTYTSYIMRGKGDPVTLLRAILLGSPCTTTDGVSRTLCLYIESIRLLSGNDIGHKTASQLLGVLLMQVDVLPAKCLAELANNFVDSVKTGEIRNGKAFVLFPKILSSIGTKATVCYGNNDMTGADYSSHILNILCSAKWHPDCVTHLAAMFRDVPLTNEELQFVIDKILRMFKSMDLQELPPLIYQLLLLSTKGHKRLVLEGVSTFFCQQDNICRAQNHSEYSEEVSSVSQDQLRHIEGTVILHVTFAVKQDQELGREFIKYLKAGQQGSSAKIVTAFNMALALSVARIHRFEEPVFDFLKTAILKSYKDEDKKKSSKWIEELVPESFSVSDQVLETVQNSLYGWDHVNQGLVQLGFTLMDSFGPRPGAFGKTLESIPSSQHKTPNQKACDLGAKVLLNTFKAHDVVRSEILEQILNRVVTKATTPVSHYIELFSSTVKSAPQILLESLSVVREAIDYLAYLPTTSAEGLLKAVQPLMKISITLKDSLILILRKAMFSRHGDARKIAVTGFIKILKHFKVLGCLSASQSSQSFISSQVQVDVHSNHSSSSNEALCLEILGNLRRCLTQQADVRLILYEGLYDVLTRNPQLKCAILEMLLSQLKAYYEAGTDVNPPIVLAPCITAQGDSVYLVEPLSHLLCAVSHSLLWLEQPSNQENDDDDDLSVSDSLRNELDEMMQSLTQRMIKSEMEDFELDKSADFSVTSGVGTRNNIHAILVMGIYEVLMEYNFTGGDFSTSDAELVVKLFEKYHDLYDILKEKSSSASKKGRSSNTASRIPTSLLSLKFVTMMLRAIFCDDIPSHQECLVLYRDNQDLLRYIVNVALQKIQQIHDRGHCEGMQGKNQDKIYKYTTTLARVLLRKYSTDAYSPDERASKDRGKALSSLCLEGLHTIINIVCNRYPKNMVDFLHHLNSDENTSKDDDIDGQVIIHQHIKKFQRLIMNIVNSGEDEDVTTKDAVPLCNIISLLSKYLICTGTQFVQLHSWVSKLCQEQNLDDSSLTKAFINLLFLLTSQSNSNITITRDIGQDIHSQVGDMDQDVEVEDKTHYAIINPRTFAPVLTILHVQVEKYIDEAEWVLGVMKNEAISSNLGSPGCTQKESLEKAVCTRLGILVTSFHELVQSALPVGMAVDTVIKMVTRLYGTLSILTKYYISLYNQHNGHLSTRFEKLVKLIGTHLTQQCYAMINYIQLSQNDEHNPSIADASKNTKGKKKQATAVASTSNGKSKLLKEARSIPNLIYSIEQYEKFLIQLSKKSKINLMQYNKSSTARDFRIITETVQAALRQQETSSEEEDEAVVPATAEENAEDNNEPPVKKMKINKLKKGRK